MEQELFYTMNIKVAAALLTLGFRPNVRPVERIVRQDGIESVVFWFDAQNDDGVKAIDVMNGMTKGGEKLAKTDPENPINYMRCFAANRDEMVNLIKQTPRKVVVEKNGTKAMLSENASEQAKIKAAKFL